MMDTPIQGIPILDTPILGIPIIDIPITDIPILHWFQNHFNIFLP